MVDGVSVWDNGRPKKQRPGCVRCSSDNRRNGDQAALTLRAKSRQDPIVAQRRRCSHYAHMRV
jgi:hypothetical protein